MFYLNNLKFWVNFKISILYVKMYKITRKLTNASWRHTSWDLWETMLPMIKCAMVQYSLIMSHRHYFHIMQSWGRGFLVDFMFQRFFNKVGILYTEDDLKIYKILCGKFVGIFYQVQFPFESASKVRFFYVSYFIRALCV